MENGGGGGLLIFNNPSSFLPTLHFTSLRSSSFDTGLPSGPCDHVFHKTVVLFSLLLLILPSSLMSLSFILSFHSSPSSHFVHCSRSIVAHSSSHCPPLMSSHVLSHSSMAPCPSHSSPPKSWSHYPPSLICSLHPSHHCIA